MPASHPLQTYYSQIYKRYNLINRLFTFGLDKKWRLRTIKNCLSYQPGKVLDLCCGTGDLTLGLARRTKKPVTITGFDLNKEMLSIAVARAETKNLTNVEFIRGNVNSMPFSDASFDAVTIAFGFRNLMFENPDRKKYISEISRVTKPGGRLFILESSSPTKPFLKFFYNFYLFAVLIPLGGLISGNAKAYRYLARSSMGFYKFEEIGEFLLPSFSDLKLEKSFLYGAAGLISAIRKQD